MNFKFIYEGISRKITFSFLTIIQFIISILCIYVSIQVINNINVSIDSINKYFHDGRYYEIDDKMTISELAGFDKANIVKNIEQLKEVKEYLESNNKIEFLTVKDNPILVRKDIALEQTVVTYDTVNFQSVEYIRVNGLAVNKNFLDRMNYEFIAGSTNDFTKNNDDEYVPIILGSMYKDKYKVGDTIEIIDINTEIQDDNDIDNYFKKDTLKVVAILADNSYVHDNGIASEKKSLNNFIIYPFNEEIMLKESNSERVNGTIKISLMDYLSNGYLILKGNEDVDKINKDLLNFKLKYQLNDLNKTMKEYKNEVIDELKPVIYTVAIVIVFSIISIIIVMMNSIIKEKKDFGINIMLGATMMDIKIRVLGQILLLLGFSILISTIILKSFDIFKFNILDFALTVGVMIVILIVISSIIILTLNKYSINDLIRRNE